MKSIRVNVHPFVIAAAIAIVPIAALSAGSVLSAPASVSGTLIGAVFSSTNSGTGPAGSFIAAKAPAVYAKSSAADGLDAYASGAFAGVGAFGTSGAAGIFGSTDTNAGGSFLASGANGYGVFAKSMLGNGVLGISVGPNTSGVIGTASGLNSNGVGGQATSGAGVYGISNSGIGGYFKSSGNEGIVATTTANQHNAISASTTASNAGGVYGFVSGVNSSALIGSATTGTGANLQSTSGTALYAKSSTGPGAIATSGGSAVAGLTGINTASGGTAVYGKSNNGYGMVLNAGGPTTLLVANAAPTPIALLSLDNKGNLYIRGTLTAAHLTTTATASASTDGEGSLVGGRAFVALDPTFVRELTAREPYLVTVTPEADSNGLFVAKRVRDGFVVKENAGGKSNLAFTYHVVGRRATETAAVPDGVKLPVVPVVDVPNLSQPQIPPHAMR